MLTTKRRDRLAREVPPPALPLDRRADASPSVAVLVPTYRRPADLARCLGGLAAQRLAPVSVVVVVRVGEDETEAVLSAARGTVPLHVVRVTEPGAVHALNAGLATIDAEIVAITDDDAVPFPDWTERLVRHFVSDPTIGGVGGRDHMRIAGVMQTGRARTVGRVPRVGKHVGNHHLGFGSPRSVDVLKGVNCAYRMDVIRKIGIDTRLRGCGAQVHWEISLGIRVARMGLRLIYDPACAVDHYLAARAKHDEDQRGIFHPTAIANAAYNEMLVRLEFLSPPERVVHLAWALCIGTKEAPGLVQVVRFVARERSVAWKKFLAVARGSLDAARAVCSGTVEPFPVADARRAYGEAATRA